MPSSVRKHLERDLECEGLLECFHSLVALDRPMFLAFARGC
jgi:predicted transcriptional regulator